MEKQADWFIEDARALLRETRSLSLATANAEGRPQASYAPYVLHDCGLYVFVSALAPHTANLRAREEASVMLLRDEACCEDIYARPRLLLRCRVEAVARDDGCWAEVLELMRARLGETANTVRELPDFALFRLCPVEGQVVSGFARARSLNAAMVTRVLVAL